MDDILDMIASNESPMSVSDRIKEVIQAKAVAKIDEIKPMVSSSMFGEYETEQEEE